MTLFSEPLLTREYEQGAFALPHGATYLHGVGATEERYELGAEWVSAMRARGVTFWPIVREEEDLVVVQQPSGLDAPTSLRSSRELRALVARLPEPVYIDVTALTHNSWAALLKTCVEVGIDHTLVYSEPASYRESASPSRGLLYDLSDKIRDIAPLPGFAKFSFPDADAGNVVALLGFEGARLGNVIETLQVDESHVVPIVGVPGFAADHPFRAFAGNSESLVEEFLYRRVRFAKANCPFDAFHQLHQIFGDWGWGHGKVAPIGTKPHGIGAVLFALSRRDSVELVYDHPVRSEKRSRGKRRLCVYETGIFVQSDLFLRSGNYA